MRILIADDHAIVRQGLKQTIADAISKVAFGEAANAAEAIENVWKHDWDLVLLDVSMPGRSGLEVLKEIKQARPKLPVIILSSHPEDQYAVRCLRAGAAGYLNKDVATEELVNAVKKTLKGGRYVSPHLAEQLVFELNAPSEQPLHTALSNREYEIMVRLASGETVTTIAHELNLSVKTISTHRTHVLEKMGLKSNADLTRYALDYNLIR